MIKRQQGQTLTEYAIIIGFIAIVVIAALILFGGGIGGVFQRTSDALGDGEQEPTATPEPTPTPDAYTFSCSTEFALSKQSSVQFTCSMDPAILKLGDVERVTLSVSPGLPDFHVVMFKFPSMKETRFFCGPGGCRGFSGSTTYLYPFEDTSDTLPDEWTSNSQLRRWITETISGHANYYRLKGDGAKPGAWALTIPEAPWAGVLNITVFGRPAETAISK
jgi:Flp pilus assembly pilin Flp